MLLLLRRRLTANDNNRTIDRELIINTRKQPKNTLTDAIAVAPAFDC